MPPAGTEFLRLHQSLQELKKVQDQLARGPRQIQVRKKRIETSQLELAEQEEALKFTRAEADKKNLDLKSKEANILELQRKLNGAASNREYQIISGQIEADTAAKAVLEDEAIEYLDRVDVLQKQIEECKSRIDEAITDAELFATSFEEKAEGLRAKEATLKTQITESRSIIPKEVREQFQRLVEAYGPDAMAESSGGVCNNCYVSLTPQAKVMLNSGRTLFCGSCGRFLYQVDQFIEG
ncbi:zinc ribbon domain-containing protein [Thalassoglobus sp.]|uniref:zinc ribbon domain-containing protein n=1 Tax=Thalassoglobus sp. TaxID=2795869 RepID=UPI003AA925BB